MPHFKADPESLSDLNHTPRFYCQFCGAGTLAVRLSERKAGVGVVREMECPDCGALERVGIRLDEETPGWALFHAEETKQTGDAGQGGMAEADNGAAPELQAAG